MANEEQKEESINKIYGPWLPGFPVPKEELQAKADGVKGAVEAQAAKDKQLAFKMYVVVSGYGKYVASSIYPNYEMKIQVDDYRFIAISVYPLLIAPIEPIIYQLGYVDFIERGKFSHTSEDIVVEKKYLLCVSKKRDQSLNKTWINLDEKLSNKDGVFYFPGAAFSLTSKDETIEGSILKASLKKEDGTWVDAEVDLDDYISNIDGVLEWVPPLKV